MADDFKYDVFLSHSSKDKAVVRDVAERLKTDGLRVWFDEWEIRPGDSIPAKLEEGLEHSRVLVLCMSANAFGSDWSRLEAGTFRFRDPLNEERRFIPLRLDDAPIRGSLAQFLCINWGLADREREYVKLLESCRPPVVSAAVVGTEAARRRKPKSLVQLTAEEGFYTCALSPDRRYVLSGSYEGGRVQLWDAKTGLRLRALDGHTARVNSVAWSADQRRALSGSHDSEVRLWDIKTGRCLYDFHANRSAVWSVAWSADERYAASGSEDASVWVWDVNTGGNLVKFEGHTSRVNAVVWSVDQRNVLSGSDDSALRLWDLESSRCLRVLESHTMGVTDVKLSPDGRYALSASYDGSVRLWDLVVGRCLRVLKGHRGTVLKTAWSPDQRYALSGGVDRIVRLWDVTTGRCLCEFEGHKGIIRELAWSADGGLAYSGDQRGWLRAWNLSRLIATTGRPRVVVPIGPLAPKQVQYANAKVLLVGESGAGKTGLSKRLALDAWEPSDSTVGAWATQWKLPVASGEDTEREIWLWDFGGQADQRLIHQLFMDETALAVLVFDGQKEDVFETLGQWDRDLTRASRREFAKLLVAGRVDAGGLRVSRDEVEKFAAEHKFRGFLETSAKNNLGCEELKHAILVSIDWDKIPCRTTEVLFKRLKEGIIRLKDEGRALMRFNELRETLRLGLPGELRQFGDEELRAVLALLAGPGVVWELSFGSWVLLQPERINAYAQAVIRTLRTDEYERGCLLEERILKGDLKYESSMPRLVSDEERFVLLAMHQILVERGLCLRQPTTKGNLLVFPSYYRKERPDIVQYPAVQVNYRFSGFLDEIYATLVVRLHYSEAFRGDHLWRRAADFRTNTGKQLGVKLTRCAPGVGELDLYFDPAVSIEEKIIFSKYVHEHLLQHAKDVERLRLYVCPRCGTPVGNREVAMKRLSEWLQGRSPQPSTATRRKPPRQKDTPPGIICVGCEEQVPLWDEMEQCFASPEIQERVRCMREESKFVLDNESKERALVGEVISTVALAGQICREFNVSDHGIDMEIEFKDDADAATGRKLYLQLKSGDSYLRERKKDGAEVFAIKEERHAGYWMAQAFHVLLVIRTSDGEVRWMEVRDWLKRESDNGKKTVKQIPFDGERFDVMSVRRWRDRALGESRA